MVIRKLLTKLGHKSLSDSIPDESLQIRMFADAGLDWEQSCRIANQTVIESGIPRTDPSNHYEIFAGISQVCTPTSILEIGTHRGVFTAFLAALWPAAKIVTYELPIKESLPRKLAVEPDLNRHYVPEFRNDADYRDAILSRFPNIELRLQDSSALTHSLETFQVVWIDGDHRYPVVAFDVANAVRLCDPKGWIGVDDIRLRGTKVSNTSMGSTEGHETVRRITAAGMTNLHLVLKRGQKIRSQQTLAEHKHIAILRRN